MDALTRRSRFDQAMEKERQADTVNHLAAIDLTLKKIAATLLRIEALLAPLEVRISTTHREKR